MYNVWRRLIRARIKRLVGLSEVSFTLCSAMCDDSSFRTEWMMTLPLTAVGP